MAISMVRAKALCSGAELALVKASSKQEIGTHTAARLKQKQTRARKLRDKWRDQVAAQRRTAKSKTGAAEGDKNSAEKAVIFDEVLARFTAQLEKAESQGQVGGADGAAALDQDGPVADTSGGARGGARAVGGSEVRNQIESEVDEEEGRAGEGEGKAGSCGGAGC
jgi:hypothetical protein